MVGVLLSANRFVRLATNPIAGMLVDRLGVRAPFVIAVFGSAATTAAYGLGAGFAVFLLARVLWGVCWSFLRLGGYLAALDAADERSRGYFLGFYAGASRAGTLLSMLTGGVLTDLLGFRATALGFAALSAVAGVLMLRERPPVRALPAERVAPAESEPALRAAPVPLRRQRWAIYAAALTRSAAGSGVVVATFGLWLLERYGETISIASIAVGVASFNGVVLSARFLGDVVWGPFAGHLSDRLGRVRAIALAGGLAVLGLVGLSLSGSLAWSVATAFVVFFAGTALGVGLEAAAGDLAPPAARARVMSTYATWSDLGAALGPFVAYQVAAQAGLIAVYRGAAACLLIAGLAALLPMRGLGRARP
jgi:MFS family permease